MFGITPDAGNNLSSMSKLCFCMYSFNIASVDGLTLTTLGFPCLAVKIDNVPLSKSMLAGVKFEASTGLIPVSLKML